MTLVLLDLKKIFFCYSTALHSKQWSTSLWYFHTDCWLWLWWYTTSLSDWSIWNVPCMEGGAFFSLFLCFCSSPQEIINTLNLNWLDCWMKYDLKLHRKLGDSHAHSLVSTGKCHWPQCKDCSGILGKALLWGSSQFRWWNNQISNKSITWGRENADELWCSHLIVIYWARVSEGTSPLPIWRWFDSGLNALFGFSLLVLYSSSRGFPQVLWFLFLTKNQYFIWFVVIQLNL